MNPATVMIWVDVLGRLVPLGRALVSDIRSAVTAPNPDTIALLDHAENVAATIIEKARRELDES